MDLNFTEEEQEFRKEVHAWIDAHLPKEISHKVHNGLQLSRTDMQRWHQILGKKAMLSLWFKCSSKV